MFLSLCSFSWLRLNSLRILVYSASCGCGHNYLKTSVKSVHSFHQFKQDKSNGKFRFQRNNSSKFTKSMVDKEDVEKRAIYMRDIISNVYNILKYSTWGWARDQLQKIPVKWDSYTVNQILKTHPPMEKAWLFFNWVSELKQFKHDQFTYTTMLDIFGEAGRVSSMKYVFEQMQEKGIKIDAVTYTSVMHWVSNSGDIDGAMRVWKEMNANGCRPTVVSYTAYMKVLFCHNKVKEAIDAYREMLRSGLSPNCHTYTVLVEYLIGSGKCKEALEIFDKMQEAKVPPDKAACNIMVEKLSKSGETWALSPILEYMKENRIVLRYPIFLEALEALKAAGGSDFLLRQVNPHCSIEVPSDDSDRKNKSDHHFSIDEGLILVLLTKENLASVDCLLAGIAEKNISLHPLVISMIIETNCDRHRLDRALQTYEYSLKRGIILPRDSYVALLGALIRSNSFPKVVEVVNELIKAGHSVGIYLASILIYKLGRAKKPKCAAKIFDLLPCDHKCSATYTALIGAYLFVGNIDKGLEVFKAMQSEEIRPSLGTYNLLLTSLSRSGRLSEHEVLRKEKKRLQTHGHAWDINPFEDKICDLIFVGDSIS